MSQALAKELIKRYENLRSKRVSTKDNTWQDIANFFLPQDSNVTVTKPSGDVVNWTDQIFDTTGIQAAMVFMAGDYNWTTPPQQAWAELGWPKDLGEPDDEAMNWLGKASDDLMETFARSNFYSQRALAALGIGVFGTDYLLFEEDEDEPGEFNFRHNRIGTYVLEEDHKGIVDTTMREFEMTFRQVEQKFRAEKDTIPEQMREASKGDTGQSKKFKILHCVFPREDSDRLPQRKDAANKPIASVYLSLDYKDSIRISGYEEQPCLVPRFTKWGTDSAYGFGPAYIALPDARELNYMAQFMDAAAEKLIDPRVLIPSLLAGDVDLRAGGQTVFDENTPKDGMPREWASGAEYKLGLEIMEQKRNSIRDAFFVSAFKLLNSEPLIDKMMTAYEISQRLAEQLQGFTPALARRIPEFINPLMKRAFAIRYRAGKLGQAPQSLFKQTRAGKSALAMPEIVVTSRISDSLKALKNTGIHQTMEFVLPISEQHPELRLLDNFKIDDLVVEEARNNGISAELIRPKKGADSVATLRGQAKAKNDAAQAAAMAETLGKAGKGLGGSPAWLQDQAKEAVQGGNGKGRGR